MRQALWWSPGVGFVQGGFERQSGSVGTLGPNPGLLAWSPGAFAGAKGRFTAVSSYSACPALGLKGPVKRSLPLSRVVAGVGVLCARSLATLKASLLTVPSSSVDKTQAFSILCL